MFEKTFLFSKEYSNKNSKEYNNLYSNNENISICAEQLFSYEIGYGFVIEKNRNEIDNLKIPELNSAFEPWSWLIDKELTNIQNFDNGCGIAKSDKIPIIFKCAVEETGNYDVSITIHGGNNGLNDVMIFIGRRRLYARISRIAPGETFEKTFTFNVCEIIPRGKETAYKENSIDVTIFADSPKITKLTIRKVDVPTIYIAGDSTVTDQGGTYPYDPGCCYSGWAQMLPMYLKQGIAVSNHSHSGLTTESFVGEGHYAIVEKHIKAGDYYFMQFGHNDQKLPHLDAFGGYAARLRKFVEEMQNKGVYPVIITPLARNTWKGDGTYNDLLHDYAEACLKVGKECNVPVLDLHKDSMEFVLKEGVESASRYFFPKDYTHGNDYGAHSTAGYIAKYCNERVLGLKDYIKENDGPFTPPNEVHMPVPPKEYEALSTSSVFTEELDRPDELITRVEALDFLVKAIRFVPTNVYNDHFPDVIGHEWYAGVVEVSCQNSILDDFLTRDGNFHPDDTVTEEQFMSFCVKSYSCRKRIKETSAFKLPDSVSSWAANYVKAADSLSLLPYNFEPQKKMTRVEVVNVLKELEKIL